MTIESVTIYDFMEHKNSKTESVKIERKWAIVWTTAIMGTTEIKRMIYVAVKKHENLINKLKLFCVYMHLYE